MNRGKFRQQLLRVVILYILNKIITGQLCFKQWIKYFSIPTTIPPLAPIQLVRYRCWPVLLREVEGV